MKDLFDVEQFELFRAGDKQAFAYFYVKHHQGIYKYILDLSNDTDVAKEITQDVFTRSWDLRDRISRYHLLEDHLYEMARQLFLQHLGRQETAFNAAEDLTYATRQGDLMNKELALTCNHGIVAVDAALKLLSPMEKLVLGLLYLKGYETAKVAGMMGIPPQAVVEIKNRALEFLRGKLYDRDLLQPMVLAAQLFYLDKG